MLKSALVVAGAVAAAADVPLLPSTFVATGLGAFTDGSNCTFAGNMYLNDDMGLWRSDFSFLNGPACAAQAPTAPWKMTILNRRPHIVQSFFFQGNASSLTCDTYPVPGFLEPSYLLNASVVGTDTITTLWGETVSATVYNSTGQYASGSLLTYVRSDSNAIVRHAVQLTDTSFGAAPYILDFSSIVESTPDAVGLNVFIPFPNQGCMPV